MASIRNPSSTTGRPGPYAGLQVKEARAPALEPYARKILHANHGKRVIAGQRLMQSASDIFLGWTQGLDKRHYYVRQLRDMKISAINRRLGRQHIAGVLENVRPGAGARGRATPR
jgi:Uncharacterized protein conserved in bacteria (DUF2252)